jgi:F-type H+-transporting ATPase subunit a
LPIAATAFLFILTANWMGILPLFGEGELYVQRGGEQTNVLRSANSDLNVTAAMALIVFVVVEFIGFRSGGLAYAKEFIWPGLLIEVISHLARPVALALRLFGNILAGEILLIVMGSLVPILVPAFFLGFEMFVGIVQALIFALLTLAFLSMSTAHEAAHQLAEEAGEGATHH